MFRSTGALCSQETQLGAAGKERVLGKLRLPGAPTASKESTWEGLSKLGGEGDNKDVSHRGGQVQCCGFSAPLLQPCPSLDFQDCPSRRKVWLGLWALLQVGEKVPSCNHG